MEASSFWQIIGEYNLATFWIQIILLATLAGSVAIAYLKRKGWVCKFVLAVINLFIAFGFFLNHGTEPIQKYFALPLFIGTGVLLLFDSWKNPNDEMQKPSAWQWVFFALFLAYPLVSLACGHSWPQMVTHIMPCPVITITLTLYASYKKKNTILLALLTIWGLTGVKAIIFAAYEDLILLAAGIYGVILIIENISMKKSNNS